MKLEKLSAIAEIVSSIAIVVTLAYLAIQTQQNTTAIQATIRQSMLAEDAEIINQFMEYPVTVTGRYADGDLTDEDLVRLAGFFLGIVRNRENQWLQYRNGVIDERTWLTYRSAIATTFSSELARSWWRNRSTRGEFDEAFVDVFNEVLAQSPVRPTQSLREVLGFDPL